jgi:hypothetical protein
MRVAAGWAELPAAGSLTPAGSGSQASGSMAAAPFDGFLEHAVY